MMHAGISSLELAPETLSEAQSCPVAPFPAPLSGHVQNLIQEA